VQVRDRATHQGWRLSHEQTFTTTNATMEITMKKVLLPLKDPKARAGVGDVNQTEEIGTINACLIRVDQSQDQLLAPLIKSVEREREKENELHAVVSFIRASRAKSAALRL
jgi:hypothetical protein